MWTVSRIVAMVILTGLSFMDYKIRKVPRDVLLLCMAGTVLYQAVTQNIDWMVSLGGGDAGKCGHAVQFALQRLYVRH